MAGYYSGIGVNGRHDPFWRGIYDSEAQLLNDRKTQRITKMAPVETEATFARERKTVPPDLDSDSKLP